MRHLKHLKYQIIYPIGLIAFIIWGPTLSNSDTYKLVVIVLTVTTIPTLLIHLTYFLINKNSSVTLKDNSITIQTKEEKREIGFEEITDLKRVMTNNFAEGNTPFLPWEDYHYFILTTNSNQFIITSLLVDRLDEKITIDKNKLTTEIDWFPIITQTTKKKED
jgi:hypothetical protein